MPQIQGIKYEAVPLQRDCPAAGGNNEGDGVSSAFPKDKQNGIVLKDLYLIYRSVMKIHLYLQNILKTKHL